ncbi:MAG TPA: YebC/PmpR family DNA-binding transcriptional regulator [Firmicutes bacterium]|jgi:YebC/PmpR family DNA-binding regulatory protein|nr:YebC/PmpR family DNA-binding transcriptional regulator [Bacillota bacterium]HAV19795.1 YebC/PmpR family DNA-binding transcriptional regulator [Bacillota bacterium]
MGRHFQVREAAMAATGAKKSALYMRASKEIYMAAKGGLPDPDSNLALRSAIDKFKGQSVPKDVIERAIKKAMGGEAEAYVEGRYEAFGPSGSLLIVDTLTDNVNRAFVDVRTAITRKGGHLATVAYNFTQAGILVFKGENPDQYGDALILSDVDITDISGHDGVIEIQVNPSSLNAAKVALKEMGIDDFEVCEITMLPNETIKLEGEDLDTFKALLDVLDELQDVQNVYHNVELT